VIQRELADKLLKKGLPRKVLVLLGARQTGKTTLVENALPADARILSLTGDDPSTINMLESASLESLKLRLADCDVVFIDEAQRIPNIGVIAKLIADNIKGVRLILTGSSSLELAEGTYESLTGRKRELHLFPISWKELTKNTGAVNAAAQLQTRLVYGMYPEVITSPGREMEVLRELVNSYLYRDLLNFGGIRKPRLLEKILQALAWQIGSEVSLTEVAQLVDADKATVEAYIDLLEKSFIIFRLNPLSRNMRNEIRKFSKVYFWDNGVRNMLVSHLADAGMRDDTGKLFENFMIAERMKKLSYTQSVAKSWFWRTQSQQEIDYVEELNGKFNAVEIKWNPKTKVKFPNSFIEAYQPDMLVVNQNNFDSWLM
jgi:predicted AAA+ superfamily ATPase